MPTRDSGGDSSGKRHSKAKGVDDEEYATIDLVTRRRLLSLGASASLTSLLAGCQGDQDDVDATVDTDQDGGDSSMDPSDSQQGDTTLTEGPGGEVTMRTFVEWDWPAGETQMHSLAPSNWPGDYSGAFFHAPCTVWSYSENKYIPYLLKELPTYRECYQQHTLREDFKWWDGMEHNALDQVYGHQCVSWSCCGGPEEVVWSAMKGDNKFVWEENKGAPYTEQQAAANAQKGVQFRRDIFKPLLENFQEAESEEDINAATEELNDLSLTLDNLDEHMNGTGLWKPVDWSADEIIMEQFEEHPDYQRTDIDRWVIQLAPKKQTQIQLINNDRVDTGSTNFRSRLQNPPQNLETVMEAPGSTGKAIKFNWRRKHGGNRHFRRALASLLPMDNITKAAVQAGETAQPLDFQAMAGPRGVVEQWTDDGFIDKLIDYGVSSRPDEATQRLEAGDYSKQNGNWVGPDGEQVQLRMIAQNQSLNSNIGSAVSGILNNFGISVDFSVLESGSYAEEYGTRENPPDGEFDITIEGPSVGRIARDLMGGVDELDETVGWARPAPDDCVGEPLKAPLNPSEPMPKQDDGSGWETWHYGIPITEEGAFPAVPAEIGQEDLSGETVRHKLFHHNVWAQYRFPDEQLKEWVTQQLWWNNFHMHGISFYVSSEELWMNSDKFRMKDDGQVYDIRPDYYPHRFGDVESA